MNSTRSLKILAVVLTVLIVLSSGVLWTLVASGTTDTSLDDLLAVGTGNDDAQPDTAPAQNADIGDRQRIITLAPAMSQMLVDMGKGDQIVGMGDFDTVAPKGIPVVGNFLDVNTEAVLRTHPTLVLHMAGKDGPPQRLLDLQSDTTRVFSAPSPLTIDQIADLLYNQSNRPSLEWVFRDNTAKTVCARMLIRLEAIRRVTAKLDRPKTLLVIGSNPIMAVGPETVHSQLLAIAGGKNAAADATVGAPTYDREALAAMAPEIIIFLAPGAPMLKSISEDPRLEEIKDLKIPAVAHNHIYLLNDSLILLPSSNIAHTAAEIAKVIHPDQASKFDLIMNSRVLEASADQINPKRLAEDLPTDTTQPAVVAETEPSDNSDSSNTVATTAPSDVTPATTAPATTQPTSQPTTTPATATPVPPATSPAKAP